MTGRRKTPEPYVYIPGTRPRDRGKTPESRQTDKTGKLISLSFRLAAKTPKRQADEPTG